MPVLLQWVDLHAGNAGGTDQHLLHRVAGGIEVDAAHHHAGTLDQLRRGIERQLEALGFELIR